MELGELREVGVWNSTQPFQSHILGERGKRETRILSARISRGVRFHHGRMHEENRRKRKEGRTTLSRESGNHIGGRCLRGESDEKMKEVQFG
jgi:hypothetical protein